MSPHAPTGFSFVAGAFLRARPWIVAPTQALAVALLLVDGAPRAQLVRICAGFVLLTSHFIYEAWRAARVPVSARRFTTTLVVTIAGITMGAMMSGGARSPLAPLLFAPVGIGFAAFGRQRAALACGAAGACAIAIWTCAPPLFAPPSPRIDAALSALVLTATLALLFAGVRTLAQAHDRAIDVATHAGDALVDQAALRARALEALGQKIAHEVKNPLTAVRGLCELSLESARASNGDVKTAKRLEVALSEVLRAQSILESYLSFARPLFALARSDVDVADLARAVVQALEATALGRGVSLSTEADNAGTAHLDSERMREALFNLVLNALDATPRGGRVEVRARVEAERARFVVVDDGAGMPPDVLARVGTPFHTTKEQGTGLGVALARHTAEAHGGTLAFESTPGGGTRAVVDVSVRGEAHGEDRDR